MGYEVVTADTVGFTGLTGYYAVREPGTSHYVFLGSQTQCEDFAYLMNKTRAERKRSDLSLGVMPPKPVPTVAKEPSPADVANIFGFLAKYLPTLKDPVFVEIGPARGEDSAYFIQFLRGNWSYYAFEADPRNAQAFREKIKHPRVIFTEAAVGSHCGETTFWMSGPEHVWSSSMRKPKEHLTVSPQITFDQTCTAKLLTLDSFFADKGISKIDFLWCDAQGGEADIIQGAKETLAKVKYLLLEYSDIELYEGQATYQGLLNQLGPDFEVVKKYDEDVVSGKSPDGNVLLRNKTVV